MRADCNPDFKLAGYVSREIIATPWTDQKIRVCQAFAWNPSIIEAKAD
jgi:hypothetical protein